MHRDTGIMNRKTISEIVFSYDEAIKTARAGYALLQKSQDMMREAMGEEGRSSRFSVVEGYQEPSDIIKGIEIKLKRDAWRSIINMTGVRKILSVKRAEELDKQLENWKDAPEITLENVMDTVNAMVGQSKDFLRDAVVEVFEFLRPGAYYRNQYKTNQKNGRWELGKKIIKSNIVNRGYSGCYQMNYCYEKHFIAVDKVFHALDSKGVPDGYRSPLVDAVNTTSMDTGAGETDYFKFKCYGNGNLHLEFKRMDLVAQLNRHAGGNNLKPGQVELWQ